MPYEVTRTHDPRSSSGCTRPPRRPPAMARHRRGRRFPDPGPSTCHSPARLGRQAPPAPRIPPIQDKASHQPRYHHGHRACNRRPGSGYPAKRTSGTASSPRQVPRTQPIADEDNREGPAGCQNCARDPNLQFPESARDHHAARSYSPTSPPGPVRRRICDDTRSAVPAGAIAPLPGRPGADDARGKARHAHPAFGRSMRGTPQVHERSTVRRGNGPQPTRLTRGPRTGLMRSPCARTSGNYPPYSLHRQAGAVDRDLGAGAARRSPESAGTMFARCLLGCRGTTRQRPVPGGSGSRGLPHNPAGCSIRRHRKVFSNTLSSGLLICGHIGPVAGGSRRQPTDLYLRLGPGSASSADVADGTPPDCSRRICASRPGTSLAAAQADVAAW